MCVFCDLLVLISELDWILENACEWSAESTTCFSWSPSHHHIYNNKKTRYNNNTKYNNNNKTTQQHASHTHTHTHTTWWHLNKSTIIIMCLLLSSIIKFFLLPFSHFSPYIYFYCYLLLKEECLSLTPLTAQRCLSLLFNTLVDIYIADMAWVIGIVIEGWATLIRTTSTVNRVTKQIHACTTTLSIDVQWQIVSM